MNHADAPLIQLENLAVTFLTPRGAFRAVRSASLEIARGEVLGLVGESGCGKSTVAFAMMNYLPGTAQVEGAVRFEGMDISELSDADLRELRGNRIAMVYQDPITSLNPSMRVGPQIEEAIREHLDMDADAVQRRAVELFDSVGLADPERIGRRYPHQLSGGQQQRVVIAMALACDPHLLIMDEPTTGLDVTTEATILDLIVELKDRVNAGILFVSHNLGVIARVADRVAVMYAGEIVRRSAGARTVQEPATSLHGRLAVLRAAAAGRRRRRASAQKHPRLRVRRAERANRVLPVRAALPPRARRMSSGFAAHRAGRGRACRQMLLPRGSYR